MALIWKRRWVDLAISAILLSIPILILSSSLKDLESRNGLDKAVVRLAGPVQSLVSWVIERTGGIFGSYVALVDVEDENEELRAENERLRVQIQALNTRVTDVDHLEALLGMKRREKGLLVGARVVSLGVNPLFRVARIKLETDAPVAVGMPVISSEGLVGRVHHVYGRYVDVLMISDPLSSLDVELPRAQVRGVLSGREGKQGYYCEIEYLARAAKVKKGDEVVTSGLGGTIPANLVVGTVSVVDDAEYGLYQRVEVAPLVNFRRLKRVLIIVTPEAGANVSGRGDGQPVRASSYIQAPEIRPF